MAKSYNKLLNWDKKRMQDVYLCDVDESFRGSCNVKSNHNYSCTCCKNATSKEAIATHLHIVGKM